MLPPRPLTALISGSVVLLATLPAQAQLTPDATLGPEASLVTPGVELPSGVAELIEGGAIRGSNLFHSFLEFNIDAGQRVYFANPAGIESILSRVTGGNPSNIFGTLGVDGAADLFLINPNGLVFGENATLDIQGSFYGSTAEAIPLGDSVYSATAPEQSSLLTIDPSAMVSTYLSEASGDIESRGQLAAQENLTLAANTLDLQGQVAAGGDLTLLGLDTVQIRDGVDTPFVGFAGGDLLVQGNEQVDIVALSHADSGLYSYGDMVLRSASPVGGDAHYWSGGSFRVEGLGGEAGDLFSPVDPIIRTLNDVVIDEYEGSSLHILAGGSVSIGTAEINAPDAGQLGLDFLQETLTLTDGTVVQVDGGAQPTLDIRAGVAPAALGEPPLALLTGFNDNTLDEFRGDAFVTAEPSNADITVGDVFIAAPNGLVLLTNQYQPNTALTGGNIVVTGEGIYGDGIDARGFGGQGGAVYLDARNDVWVTNSFINTTGLGQVGDIVIHADGTVRFDGTDGSRTTGAFANIAPGGEGTGGNVRINAANLEVLNGAQINAVVFGTGQGGNISLDIEGHTRFVGSDPIDGNVSGAFSAIGPGGEGIGGDVQITARTLEVLNGAQLSASTFGVGNAGNVILGISELARFVGNNPTGSSPSGAFSNIAPSGEGIGGDVQITARTLEVLDGAQLSAVTFGQGDAGSVILTIADLARFVGSNPIAGSPSGVFSSIQANGTGRGGNVEIRAHTLEVLNGAALSADTFGIGDAGNVILTITNLARFVGANPFTGSASGASSIIQSNGQGKGGNVEIRAYTLEVLDGAQLITSTFGIGEAGSVILTVTDLARFVGTNPITDRPSAAFSSIQANGEGKSGNVEISAHTLEVLDGALLSAATSGTGNAGSVILNITELARFVGTNPITGSSSGASSSVEENAEGKGGNVEISVRILEVLDGAVIAASSLGIGDAGNVTLNIADLARFVGNRSSGSPGGVASEIGPTSQGTGGNVEISARILEVLDGAQLSTSTFGVGDAGKVILDISELARFVGNNPTGISPSGAFSSIEIGGEGTGGDVQITARTLEVLDGAQLSAATFGQGDAGSVILAIADLARFVGSNPIANSPSGVFSNIQVEGSGRGGNVQLTAQNVEVSRGAVLVTNSLGTGDSGNIILIVPGQLLVDGGTIGANSEAFSGGQVSIQGGSIILRNDSDIQTFVGRGAGGGGNITIAGNFVIALDDSDILAFSADGQGGDIDLSRTTFFGQNPVIASGQLSREALLALDGNNRVDINATGGVEPGQITLNDNSFIENSLTNLEDVITDTAALTAGSCIARTEGEDLGAFVITGAGGLPVQPGQGGIAAFPTGVVRNLEESTATEATIVEPDGVYRLPDGRLVLSRACE